MGDVESNTTVGWHQGTEGGDRFEMVYHKGDTMRRYGMAAADQAGYATAANISQAAFDAYCSARHSGYTNETTATKAKFRACVLKIEDSL